MNSDLLWWAQTGTMPGISCAERRWLPWRKALGWAAVAAAVAVVAVLAVVDVMLLMVAMAPPL